MKKLLGDICFEIYRLGKGLWHWRRPKATYIVLLGGPGAGKGTMATLLSAHLDLPHFNIGGIIRKQMKDQTEFGQKWAPVVKSGKLIPNEAIMGLISKEISKKEYARGALIDGLRTDEQACSLDWDLAAFGDRVNIAVCLECTKEDLLERLSLRRTCSNTDCGKTYHLKFNKPKVEGVCDSCSKPLYQRDDDKPESIVTRMEEFDRVFEGIRDYYIGTGVYAVVRSTNEAGTDATFRDVLFAIEEKG